MNNLPDPSPAWTMPTGMERPCATVWRVTVRCPSTINGILRCIIPRRAKVDMKRIQVLLLQRTKMGIDRRDAGFNDFECDTLLQRLEIFNGQTDVGTYRLLI